MRDYTIACCVSRPDVFEQCLWSSARACRGSRRIFVVPIMNTNNRYSAASALNIALDAAKTDYVVIAHQDVKLLNDWFGILDQVIDTVDQDWAVIGAAGIALKFGRDDIGMWGGAAKTDTVAVGSVWADDSYLAEPPYWDGIKEPTLVHSVDECLIVVNRRSGLRFDTLLNGFHFYGIDICLQARAAAYGVYCAHLPIIHYGKYSSSLDNDSRYWPQLRLLHSKWYHRFPVMLGTHIHWYHNGDDSELTTYLPTNLESNDGISLSVKAMGVGLVRLASDKASGIV